MSLPTIEPTPQNEEANLTRARRRRQRRAIVPGDSSERAELIRSLARRTTPSFDFFLFSVLAGIILGAAMLLDAPALFVLAALLAPFMAPTLGMAVGTLAGTARVMIEALTSLGIGSLIVFLCGAVAGWAATLLLTRSYVHVSAYGHFSWPYFLVLSLGAALTAYLLARSPAQKPLVSSVAIAYGLYLPIGAAGFGMTSGAAGLWPDGLLLFAVHLVWAVLVIILTLVISGLRPLNTTAYVLSAAFAAAGLALLLFFTQQAGFQTRAAVPDRPTLPPTAAGVGMVTPEPSDLPPAASIPTASPSASHTAAPSATRAPSATPTRTLVPSLTPSMTITPAPTPVWALINAAQGDGALVREQPDYGSNVVQSVINGTLVEVLPEVSMDGTTAWIHIRLVNNKEGWVVRDLLRTATPAPSW